MGPSAFVEKTLPLVRIRYIILSYAIDFRSRIGRLSDIPGNKIVYLRRFHQIFHHLPEFGMCRIFLQIVVSILYVVKFLNKNMSKSSLDVQNQFDTTMFLDALLTFKFSTLMSLPAIWLIMYGFLESERTQRSFRAK